MGRQGNKTSGRSTGSGGLQLFVRAGHWNVRGTIRVRDQRQRIRKSLGISANRPRREAEAAARVEEARIIDILLYGKDASATWAHAAVRYLEDRAIGKPDGWRDKERPMVEKLTKIFTHTRLVEVNTHMIQSVLKRHFSHVQPQTQRRVCSTIGGVLSAATRHGLLKQKPHIPRPKGADRKIKVNKWLYPDEIRLLLSCLPEQIRLPVKVMFLQGRRPSEILYRVWADLDLKRGRERLRLGVTKTGDEETIALDPDVVGDLRSLALERRKNSQPLEGPIFLNSRGEPWHNPASHYGLPISKPFRIGRERAARQLIEEASTCGLDIDRRDWLMERADVMRQVTAYWARHNFVSHHVAGQTPAQAISEMVGWQSLAMLPRYAHLSDGHLRDAMKRVRITDDTAVEGE